MSSEPALRLMLLSSTCPSDLRLTRCMGGTCMGRRAVFTASLIDNLHKVVYFKSWKIESGIGWAGRGGWQAALDQKAWKKEP